MFPPEQFSTPQHIQIIYGESLSKQAQPLEPIVSNEKFIAAVETKRFDSFSGAIRRNLFRHSFVVFTLAASCMETFST